MALRQGMRLVADRLRARSAMAAADFHSTSAHLSPAAEGTLAKKTDADAAAARAERRKKFDLLRAKQEIMQPDSNPPSEYVQNMHDKMVETMGKGSTFPKTELFEMFHACKIRADVNLGLKLLDRLHKFRAARLKVYNRFNGDISELVAKACCQIHDPYYALRILTKYNTFGLSADIKASHQLLEYASGTLNSKLCFAILKHMRDNTIHPTADTAHIVIKQCLKKRRAQPELALAKEFHLNEVQLHPGTYDICLVSAANSGRVKDLMDILKIKEHYKIPHSPSSIFSLAKAHLLKCKPEEAAKLIAEQCKDEDVIRKYIRSMVRLWPVQLASCHTGSKKSAKSSMGFIKNMLAKMLEYLEGHGVKVDIDLERNFGAAQGEGDKYKFCFGHNEEE